VAYRQGLRSGDLLDLHLLSPAQRYRWVSYFRPSGERVVLPIERGRALRRISVIIEPVGGLSAGKAIAIGALTLPWDVWVAYLGFAWSLMFAAVIAWRRSDSKEGRILSLLLSTTVIAQLLSPLNWVSPWPGLDASLAFLGSVLSGLSVALLATFAMTFAPPANLLRRVLMWLSYASAAAIPLYGFAFIAGAWTATADPQQAWYAGIVPQLITSVLASLFPLFCAIATIAQARGTDRTRLVWVTSALGFLYVGFAVVGLAVSFDLAIGSAVELLLYNVIGFLAPAVLTYVVLSRRVLDIGFALNRALVFSAVSAVFVGAFFLVEWALGTWLSSASHTTNLVVGAAIALLLGFFVRSIHQRVDRVLDTIFFRKRHEDERAIRNFAHEAAYITDVSVLLARTKAMLEDHADATGVAILLDDGHGSYGEVSENDPAIVSLRAWRKSVDLHTLATALLGEFAYPMISRGHLVGTIVLGPKQSADPYAPDESDAILHMAHGVGGALDVLSANGRASSNGVLEAIAAMSVELKALATEIHALRR
jgi:MFS family permease